MNILDPEMARFFSRCYLLFWKALLIRKNNPLFSLLELIVPIVWILQIRLIFDPLALNFQNLEQYKRKDIFNFFPKNAECWYTPKNSFTDELMLKVSRVLNTSVSSESNEKQLVMNHFQINESRNTFWVIFQNKEPTMQKNLEYTIRSSTIGKSRMIILKDEEPLDVDPYLSSGFLALQLAIEDSFVKLWGDSSTKEIDLTIGRFPFYNINLLIVPSASRPSISTIYYISIIAFILLPLLTLEKVIQDKKSGFRDLLRILDINYSHLYFGWLIYLCITAIPVSIICTNLLYPIYANHNNALEISLFLIFYIVVSSVFMFAIGSFFNNTTKAILTCSLIWLLMARITIIVDQTLVGSSLSIKILSLGLPHSGLLYGIAALTSKNDIKNLENDEVEEDIIKKLGLSTNSTKFKYTDEVFSPKNMVSLVMVLLGWSLHIIFWHFVTIYLNNVNPGRFGNRRSWNYLCKGDFEKPTHETMHLSQKGTTNWNAVEPTHPLLKPVIRARNVTKKFGNVYPIMAVDNMTINFYQKEFIVILGKSGAGKSTLLNLIVGMDRPTKGKIYIEDNDSKIESLYSIIGFCPQENVLVDCLTVLEHLCIFGMAKGLSHKISLIESHKLLKKLDLEQEQNSKIKNLAFATQRRICLALALIGNSKILVLDEPTYGIDPDYTQRIWNLLSKFKIYELKELKGIKTVIMATNSMKATDVLADRIVIIVNGRVECYGSKKYLNQRYGMGYILSMVLLEECDLNLLQEEVQEFSAEPVTLRDTFGRVVRYNLSTRSRISELLQYLEFHKERLNIISLSINAASMEGQFLKIGLASQFRERGAYYKAGDYALMVQKRRRDLIISGERWVKLSGRKLLFQQILAMLYKKVIHVLWSWKLYLFCILLALLTITITMTISHLGSTKLFQSSEVYMNISKYTKEHSYVLFYAERDKKSKEFLTDMCTTCHTYDKVKNYHISRNISASDIMINPNLHSIEFRDRYFMSIDILKNERIKVMYSSHAVHSGPIAMNLLHNSLLRKYNCDDCKIILKSRPLINPAQWQHRLVHPQEIRNWGNAAIVISLLLILPSIDLGIVEKRSISKQLQLNTSGMTTIIYWMPNYCVDLMIYIISLGIITLIGYFAFRAMIFDFTREAFIEIFVIFLFYGTAAIPVNYCFSLLPLDTGSIYIFLLIINFMILVLLNVSVLLPAITQLMNITEKYIFEVVLHLLPPYVLSCAIENFITLFLYNYQCEKLNTCDTDFRFEDPCCQNCDDQEKYCYKPFNILIIRKSGDKYYHSIAGDITFLILQSIVFNFLLQMFEKKNRRKWINYLERIIKNVCFSKEKSISTPTLIKKEDDSIEIGVLNERNKCEELMREYEDTQSLRPDVIMVVQNLIKKYRKKTVLKGLHFRLNKNECFGLLGMNGSGKSTILKLLMGESNVTKGNAVIQNYQLKQDAEKFLGMIGYCPQYGGLNGYLTGRQTLKLFAAIRGIPYQNIRYEVDKWLDVFDLLDFENKKIDKCTWGIQRKFCILQCLIGDLPILFFDDPTCGIDILTKYAVYEVINQLQEMGRSLIISTNSIQDAEALCLRIAILQEGKFVALENCENLKNKHGNNFTLNIKSNPELRRGSMDEIKPIKRMIEETFPGIIYKEYCPQFGLTYEIPNNISHSEVFDLVGKMRTKYPTIINFSLNQPTLEQIFLALSKRPELIWIKKASLKQQIINYIRIIVRFLWRMCR